MLIAKGKKSSESLPSPRPVPGRRIATRNGVYFYRLSRKAGASERFRQDLFRLYQEANFVSETDTPDFLKGVLYNSMYCIGAFDAAGTLLGFARALGDGCSDCFIQDVAVCRDAQKHGIGTHLVQVLVQKLRAQKIDWITLISVPDAVNFYQTLGFLPMEQHVAMKFHSNSSEI